MRGNLIKSNRNISNLIPNAPVTRFAPSPTGHLHLGHIVACCFVWGLARRFGAKIILRIEDHDQTRCKPEYLDSILEDLDWLGFEPDMGYSSLDRNPIYRQSMHFERYSQAITKLNSQNLCYECSCSRSFIKKHMKQSSEGYIYNGHCLHNPPSSAKSNLIRYKIGKNSLCFNDTTHGTVTQSPYLQTGDFPILDRNGNYTYLLCVACDDINDGVNWVIRGDDLLSTTARSISLMQALGSKKLPLFTHHPLLKNKDGLKYSKALNSETIKNQRQNGSTPSKIISEVLREVGIIDGTKTVDVRDLSNIMEQWLIKNESDQP